VSIRRDYKHTTAGQRRKTTVRRHGLLVVTLILMGLFGGLLAYIKGGNAPPLSTAVVTPAPAPNRNASVPISPRPPAAPVTVAEPAPVKPKYDFYTELPKRQIDVQREGASPQSSPQPSPVRTQPAVEPLRKPTTPHKVTTAPTVAAKNP
jgi:hypothetical protein